MNRVLVFTNRLRWNQMKSEFEGYDKTWDDYYPDPLKNQVARCLFSKGENAFLAPVSDCREEGVYLIHDKVDATLFEGEDWLEGSLYVLYHSETSVNCLTTMKLMSNCSQRCGNHDVVPPKYYYPIFRILNDRDDRKLERIIDELSLSNAEKLERSAFLFLTNSVNPSSDKAALRKAYDELCQYDDLREKVMKFYELIDLKAEDASYFRSLAAFGEYIDRAVKLRKNDKE